MKNFSILRALSNILLVVPTILFFMVLSTANHLLKPEPKPVDHNLITIIERGFVPPIILQETETETDLIIPRTKKCLKECQLIAEAIVYEARSESDSGKLKVASVILNRADHNRFPNSISQVIHQPYQFSYLRDMHKQQTPSKYDWDVAYDVANYALDGNRNTEALFYLNPDVVKVLPKWALVYSYLETEGNHDFYTF